jgi:thiol-disulfide isomerase/thioredoxin
MRKLLYAILVLTVFAALTACSQERAYVLPDINGRQWNFGEALRQKPAVVMFGATFCGHCKRMAPLIDELAGKSGGEADFVILFVDEDAAMPKRVASDLGIKNARVSYNGGQFAEDVGLTGYPLVILFASNGSVAGRWSGHNPQHIAQIAQKIEDLKKK